MDIIYQYVEYFNGDLVKVGDREAYYVDGSYYFIIPTNELEQVHIEQGWFANHLIEQEYLRIAKPIKNINGQFITEENGQNYIVLQAMKYPYESKDVPTRLATFHSIGKSYAYMPRYISAYGEWQTLWEKKIALYEAYYRNQLEVRPVTRYQRLLIDTFPYIIGLTENAIQYLQESNNETRFAGSDQGCITFQRYTNQLDQPFIFSNEFIYDHPVRDIAESIRPYFLKTDGNKEAVHFLKKYEDVSPLSIFSWRLLYARLILPIHLFDFIDQTVGETNSEETYLSYRQLLDDQIKYEGHLKSFFQDNKIDPFRNQIYQLDW
ncbi:hypothetical protein BN1058_02608 [Paraliobacillus sp. PM-2]|uniref:hypothetical protein n=1 Tax=Paraliobacillus sp. PM-2 TaxID=1462524 RepID=UPI00061CD1BB|nr:hypothetical protein [Paraliobacillus sp. PM-2]CQR48254.1 hypothetical protein BN1058_02608 [Paraliobacillus sp. PM-2]